MRSSGTRDVYANSTDARYNLQLNSALLDEAGRKIDAPIRIFSQTFSPALSPIGGVRIAGKIVLAQYKGRERIGEARTPIFRALPIVIELTY
jgi:hypothetical protein